MMDASIMQIGEIDVFLDDDVIQRGKMFTFKGGETKIEKPQNRECSDKSGIPFMSKTHQYNDSLQS